MNSTLQPRRYWSGFGRAKGDRLSPGGFAVIGAGGLRWALLIVAIGGLAAYSLLAG
jgi:hypothetical protein